MSYFVSCNLVVIHISVLEDKPPRSEKREIVILKCVFILSEMFPLHLGRKYIWLFYCGTFCDFCMGFAIAFKVLNGLKNKQHCYCLLLL